MTASRACALAAVFILFYFQPNFKILISLYNHTIHVQHISTRHFCNTLVIKVLLRLNEKYAKRLKTGQNTKYFIIKTPENMCLYPGAAGCYNGITNLITFNHNKWHIHMWLHKYMFIHSFIPSIKNVLTYDVTRLKRLRGEQPSQTSSLLPLKTFSIGQSLTNTMHITYKHVVINAAFSRYCYRNAGKYKYLLHLLQV